jgi:hypothetical protein
MICKDRSNSFPPHASFLFTKFTLHALHIKEIVKHITSQTHENFLLITGKQLDGFDSDNQSICICEHGNVLKYVTQNQRCMFMFTIMAVSLS